jgi:hypothetical protein
VQGVKALPIFHYGTDSEGLRLAWDQEASWLGLKTGMRVSTTHMCWDQDWPFGLPHSLAFEDRLCCRSCSTSCCHYAEEETKIYLPNGSYEIYISQCLTMSGFWSIDLDRYLSVFH